MSTCKSVYKNQIHCELEGHNTDERGNTVHRHANLTWTSQPERQYIQYSAWHIYVGGDPVDDRDEVIFKNAAYTSTPAEEGSERDGSRKNDVQEFITQSNEMNTRYPLGNYGTYQSHTIMKQRTVTYGDWTELD